jgi:thiol-disulfide isomerase/thioredoxin
MDAIKTALSSVFGSATQTVTGGGGMGSTILYVMVVALFLAAGYWAYTKYISPVITANAGYKQGTSKIEGDGEDAGTNIDDAPVAELYLFKTDWCPHCKKAIPLFESLEHEYINKLVNGYRILFNVVDCEQEPKMADKFKIEGYPTIKLIKDDQIIEYDAKPDRENLIQFLNSVI